MSENESVYWLLEHIEGDTSAPLYLASGDATTFDPNKARKFASEADAVTFIRETARAEEWAAREHMWIGP